MDVHSNDSSLQSVDEVQVPGRLCARELPVGARQRRSPGEKSPLSRRPNRSSGNPSKLCRLAAVILPSRRVCAFVRDRVVRRNAGQKEWYRRMSFQTFVSFGRQRSFSFV